MSIRLILWTLLSGAFRCGAGQLRMTSLPCCVPESNSVRCCTRSTGGNGGRRLPQPEKLTTLTTTTAQKHKALLS
jgi:hypothetical protein